MHTDRLIVALEFLKNSISFHKENYYMQYILNNEIGSLLKGIDEFDLAIDYYYTSDSYYNRVDTTKKFIVLARLSNDKNRGVIHRNNEKYDTAQFFLFRSLDKALTVQDSAWIARNYNSFAILFKMKGDTEKAIDFYKKSLTLKKALNYKDGVITTMTNLGALFIEPGDYKKN